LSSLPALAATAATEGAGEVAASPVVQGKRGQDWGEFKVLVVDDEKDSRVLISHFLEEFGCQVFTARTGTEGLEMARKHRPDLMTLDLIMPEMTGWEVLKRIKSDAELRTIPIVIISVLAHEGRGKLLGAVDLVTKPFEREDLVRVLWRNLGRRRGGRILLVVEDETRRNSLAALVRKRGLEVASAAGGDLMTLLAHESPDAVVLDLATPGMHGVASLLELREDRVHTGLPVLAVTHPGLNDKEREMVSELATVFAIPEQAGPVLERLLEASFPFEDGASGQT
jgi:CheY-like chemotaxis protein